MGKYPNLIFSRISYEVSNLIFRPLKLLLRRLRTMQFQNTNLDVEAGNKRKTNTPEEDTSAEVEQLKKLFQELLDTRRFEINDFLEKEDSEAIMDLAQAASIFKQSKNFKALGICYNNIANIQYKNA
jgi:hypothetical protein